MRWLSFGAPGGERPGVLIDDDDVLDVAAQWPAWPRSWRTLLASGAVAEVARRCAAGHFAKRHVRRLTGLPLAPPIPDASKVIALGRNYPSHAAEQRRTSTPEPLLFAKAPSTLVGNGATVVVPAGEPKPDFEAELALIIGRTVKEVARSDALECVAGVTAFNDVSGRGAQFADKLWFRGKGYDTFGPLGPWVVSLDDLPTGPDDLALEMYVNGECMQKARTSEMTVDCAGIIAFISRHMTLLPGDVIATGTPAGVGVFREPPIFLQDGDQMEVHLEGVGVLANRVRRLS